MDFLKQKYKCGHGKNLHNKSGQGGYVANFCFFYSPDCYSRGLWSHSYLSILLNPFYDYKEAYYLFETVGQGESTVAVYWKSGSDI